jgi:hypothetical protein
MKYIASILIFVACAGEIAQAQDRIQYDTVVVYDTIVVYDTVFVEPDPDLILTSQPAISSNLMGIYFDNRTATFFRSDIIVVENNKQSMKMKKMTFLGIVILAFKSSVLAQTSFGIHTGPVAWGPVDQPKEITNPLSMGWKAGGLAELPLRGKFSLQTGMNYLLLSKARHVEEKAYEIAPYVESFVAEYNRDRDAEGSFHHMISVPLRVVASFGRFKPSIGLEFNQTFYRSQMHNDGPQPIGETLSMSTSDAGASVGVAYTVSEKVEIYSDYFTGINRKSILIHDSSGPHAIIQRNHRFEMGLRYWLR